MFSQDHMQELLAYETNGVSVVSVYLDTDSTQQSVEAIKLTVRGLLKELQPENQKDGEAIERYLDYSYDWSRPGLAMFSGKGGTFFRAYESPVAFRNRIRLGVRPYVKPLAHFLDHYAHFGVILVDKVNGRFFEYHLGELQASETVTGEEIRKVKDGAGTTFHGRGSISMSGPGGGRHEDEVIGRNLKECAAAANRFFAERPIRRLFIAGQQETVAQFRELLPKQLLSTLAGTFAIDMEASESEVRREALMLLRQVNAEREDKLVERMAALKASGGNAVTGLDAVLDAVSNRRVETLIISDGYRVPGYLQADSGFVVANLALSPLAVGELIEVADVVDAAVAQTMSQGGHVEVITEHPTLEAAGRIGAILRY